MPFIVRTVHPKHLSRNNKLLDATGAPLVRDGELDAVINNTLCNCLKQLGSVVTVAGDIFDRLNDDLVGVSDKTDALKVRMQKLKVFVEEFDPKLVTVPESDLTAFSERKSNYAARHEITTNLLCPETRPPAVRHLYAAATTPITSALETVNPGAGEMYAVTPILGVKRRRNNVDEIETRKPASLSKLRQWTSTEALGDVTVDPDCTARISAPSAFSDLPGPPSEHQDLVDSGADHKLPSPEEQVQAVANKFPSEVVPVDISGRSFERMSILRRSCIDCGGNNVRRRTGKKKIRGKRRNTIAGTDHKELEAIVGSSEINQHHSEDMTSSGVSVSTTADPHRKSHIETLKEWGRTRLRQIRNLEPQVKLRARADSLARKKWDRDEPQHSSSGNWSASSESGSTVTSHQPRSSISSGSVCNKHGTLLPFHRRVTASASSSVTSGDSTIHDEGETCSTYSCDTEGYYTSFHMDSGLKTLREEEPMAALTTTSALSESRLNESSQLGVDSEYELFGKGSTSTTASSAGTVCTTLLSPIPPPPLPQRTTSALSSGGDGKHSRTLPERKETNGKLEATDVPSKTQSLKVDKKLCQYLDRTSRMMVKQDGAKQLQLTKENINKLKQLAEEDSKYQQGGNRSLITVDVHQSGGVAGYTGSPEKCEGSPDSGHNTCSSPVDSVTETPSSMCDFEMSECSDLEGLDRVERIRSKTTINSSRIPSMCVITPPQSDDESSLKLCGGLDDSGDYVTIRDTSIISDIETDPAPLDFSSNQQEYVSLDELGTLNGNSMERKRSGAKVTLDAAGKVVYSSDSLRRRRKIHTTNTFEPGPCVAKPVSPLPQTKSLNIRPVNSSNSATTSNSTSVNNMNRAAVPSSNIISSQTGGLGHPQNPSLIANPNDVRNSPLPSRIRDRMTPRGTLTRDPCDNEPPRPLEPIVLNRSPNPRRSPVGLPLYGPGKQTFSTANPNLVPSAKPLSPLVSAERKLDAVKASSVVYPALSKARATSGHAIVKASNSPLPNRTIKGAYVKVNANFLETSIDDEPVDKKMVVKRSDSYRLANQENIPTGASTEAPAVTAGENLLESIRQAARSNNKDICDENGSSRLGTWPRNSPSESPVQASTKPSVTPSQLTSTPTKPSPGRLSSTPTQQSSTPTKFHNGMDISANLSPIVSPPESFANPPDVEYPPRMNNIAASYTNVPYTENVRNMLSNIRITELAKSYTPVQTNSQSNLDRHLSYLQNKYPTLRKDAPNVNQSPISNSSQGSNKESPINTQKLASPAKVPLNPYASIRRTPVQKTVSNEQRVPSRATSPSVSERLFPSGPTSPTRRLEVRAARSDSQRPLSPSAADRLFPNGARPLSPSSRPTSPSATERLFPNGHSRPTSPIEATERLYGTSRPLSPVRKVSSVQRPQSPLYKGPPPYQSPIRKPLVSSVSNDNFRRQSTLRKSSSPHLSHSQSEGVIESPSKSLDSSGNASSPDVTNHPEQTQSSEPDLINNTQHSLSRFIRNSVQSKSVSYGRNKMQEMAKLPDKIKQTSRLEFKNLLNKVGWSSAAGSKVSAAERLNAKVSVADRLKERTPTPRKKLVSRSNSSLSSSLHQSSELDEASSDSSASVSTVRTRLDFNNLEARPALAKVNNASRSSSFDSGSDASMPRSSALVSQQVRVFASGPKTPTTPTEDKINKNAPALETAL